MVLEHRWVLGLGKHITAQGRNTPGPQLESIALYVLLALSPHDCFEECDLRGEFKIGCLWDTDRGESVALPHTGWVTFFGFWLNAEDARMWRVYGPVLSLLACVHLLCAPAEPWAFGREAHHSAPSNPCAQEGAGLRFQQRRQRGEWEDQWRPCWHQARGGPSLHHD